jgi:hypothetical protein
LRTVRLLLGITDAAPPRKKPAPRRKKKGR